MAVQLLPLLLFVLITEYPPVKSILDCSVAVHTNGSSQVTIRPNCSALHPEVTWMATDQFYDNRIGVESIEVQYRCTFNSTALDTPTFGSRPISPFGTHTFSHETVQLPAGAKCVFSGCYSFVNINTERPKLEVIAIEGINCTIDIDECSNGQADCPVNAECFNTIGGYYCLCIDGYNMTEEGQCQNIDECAIGAHQCHTSAECTDTQGGYQCLCIDGYSGDGYNCTNIDECQSGHHQCYDRRATCIDTEGSYYCQCFLGYWWNGYFCEDINECDSGDVCVMMNAYCKNIDGSYECQCLEGFEFSLGSGDGSGSTVEPTCINVNECQRELHNCRNDRAVCIDTEGDYYCQCLQGYIWDGEMCKDMSECDNGRLPCYGKKVGCSTTEGGHNCQCQDGYRWNGTGCEDIDECGEGSHTCSVNALCVNTNGGYVCACRLGYMEVLVTDGNSTEERICTNINECESEVTPCQENANCSDTNGSYECICLPGYRADPGGSCTNVDECQEGSHHCDSNAECTDTEGSYKCSCNFGFTGDGQECEIDPLAIVIGVGLSTLIVLTLLVIVISCILARRKKRNSLNRQIEQFFPWANEVNPNFAPVDAVSRVHYSPSISSTFERLEKMSKGAQSDREGDYDTTGQTQLSFCSLPIYELELDSSGGYALHFFRSPGSEQGSMTNLQNLSVSPPTIANNIPQAFSHPCESETDSLALASTPEVPDSTRRDKMMVDFCDDSGLGVMDDSSMLRENAVVERPEYGLVGGYLQEANPRVTPELEAESDYDMLKDQSIFAPQLQDLSAFEACRSTQSTDIEASDECAAASDDNFQGADQNLKDSVQGRSRPFLQGDPTDPPLLPSPLYMLPISLEELCSHKGYLPHAGLLLCHSDSTDSGYDCALTNGSSCSSNKHGWNENDSDVFSLPDHDLSSSPIPSPTPR